MRRSPSEGSHALWAILRRDRVGEHFRREHQMGSFYLDFYCARLQLAIEVDGEPHFTEEGRAYDALRTRALGRLGVRVIRFENRTVVSNPLLTEHEILRIIRERVEELSCPLSPG